MRVCYFGTYERDYPRNSLVVAALRAAGLDVIECHVPVWERQRDKSGLHAGPAAAMILLRLLFAHLRLAFMYLRLPRHDAMIVGYVGQFDMPVAWLLSRLRAVPLVFNPLVSIYDTFCDDRALVRPSSVRGRLLRFIDSVACRAADLVVLDTRQQVEYFSKTFGVREGRFRILPVGADDRLFRATPPRPHEGRPLEVLFVGKLIPLHGCETILRAAGLLSSRSIRFTLVGTGQEGALVRRLVAELGLDNVTLVDWVAYEDLPALYAGCDVCLGVFGRSDKAARVIPNKVFQGLAAGRPVLTADSGAVRDELRPWEEVAVCPPADPHALAAALHRLADDPELRGRLAACGRRAFDRRFGVLQLGRAAAAVLAEMIPGLAPDDRMNWGSQPDFFGPRHRNREAYLARAVRSRAPGSRLLDAACGAGTLARQLEREGFEVTALDLSSRFTHSGRRGPGHDPLRRVQGDVTRLPLRDGLFDGVIAGEVLEHLEDDAVAVREFHRVLRPGGVVVISVPADPDKWEWLDDWAGHRRRYGAGDMLSLLLTNGFEVLRIRHIGFPFVRLFHRYVYLPYLRRARILHGSSARLGREGWANRLGGQAFGLMFNFDRLFDRLPWGITLVATARKEPAAPPRGCPHRAEPLGTDGGPE